MCKNKTIILSGGGTGGSVTPLLFIKSELEKDNLNFDFIWVGTRNGVEIDMVKNENLEYIGISSGRFRRYFSWQNFTDIFKIIKGFFDSMVIISRKKPDVIISAGGFVSVPLVWAGWIFRIPILIHQQDIRAGLANKLMAPFAKKITVNFEKSLLDYGKKASWVGNPFLIKKYDEIDIKLELNLRNDLPVVLIFGGGTGALAINNLVKESIAELSRMAQIVHVYGKGRGVEINDKNYHGFEFLEHQKIIALLKIADLVVSRPGLGFLTEISFLGKAVILIPMPNTHQEDNAEFFKEKKSAIVLNQKELNRDSFAKNIKDLLDDKIKRKRMEENIKKAIKNGAEVKIAEYIIKIIK